MDEEKELPRDFRARISFKMAVKLCAFSLDC